MTRFGNLEKTRAHGQMSKHVIDLKISQMTLFDDFVKELVDMVIISDDLHTTKKTLWTSRHRENANFFDG